MGLRGLLGQRSWDHPGHTALSSGSFLASLFTFLQSFYFILSKPYFWPRPARHVGP